MIFDWTAGIVRQQGKVATLSRQQADIMDILWRAVPRPAKRGDIVARLYGAAEEPPSADETVRVQVNKLRKRLADADIDVEIVTVRGMGYGLVFKNRVDLPGIIQHHALSEAMALIDQADTIDALGQVFNRVMSNLGLGYAGYQLLKIGSLPDNVVLPLLFIANVPKAWEEEYIRENYIVDDPTVAKALDRPGFWWWRSDELPEDLTERQRRIVARAAAHGIRGGVTLAIHDHDGTKAQMNLFTDHDHDQAKAHIQANRTFLLLLGQYFHAKAARVLRELVAHNNHISLFS